MTLRERIIFGTSSSFLYSLDARTGEPDPDFGEDGRVARERRRRSDRR